MGIDANEPLLPWVALNLIQNMDPGNLPRLAAHFGSARAAIDASEKELKSCGFLTQTAVGHIMAAKATYPAAAIQEAELAEKLGVSIINIESEQYPELLAQISVPPPLMYIKGEVIPRDSAAVAIVGTRKCTAYGRDIAFELAGELARNGVTVISGLAHGIDTAAHQGALRASGRTIAALGSGLNVIYPSINKKLSEEIAESGALVSEFPLNTSPDKWNFPRRNRIISGLSLGVVIVEAPESSGALITASFALEQGREVFAVPGNVKSYLSRGPHKLLRDGACLVETVDDILRELRLDSPPKQAELELAPALSGREKELYDMISIEPVEMGELCRRTGCSAAEAGAALTMLEMKKCVRKLPGGMFVKA